MVVQWNLAEPENGRLLARMKGSVYSLCYLPESSWLIVAVNRDGFHFIDTKAMEERFSLPTPETRWFRMMPDNKGCVLAVGSEGRIALIDPEQRTLTKVAAGQSDIRSLAQFGAEGGFITGSSDGMLRYLDSKGKVINELPSGHKSTVFGLVSYPDRKRILSSGRDAHLILHQNTENEMIEQSLSVPAHLYGIHDVVLHPERPILASGGLDKSIKIWGAEDLKLLRVLDRFRNSGHSSSVNHLCWLAKPDLLLSCSDDQTIRAWNIFE